MSSKYLEDLLSLPVQTNMRLMPPKASPSDSVSSIVNIMVGENIGAVVVVEGDRPVGIITEKDVLERVVRRRKDMEETRAEDIMSKPPISIEADRPMIDALNLMRKNNIRRLPVTKDDKLVGLVTERRLLEVAFLVT